MNDKGSDQPADARSVCAVLVTYHPDPAFPARLGRIASQVGATVVVDNGSSAAALDMLGQATAAVTGATLIRNDENLGIARALNIGVQYAQAHGSSWALLLDQDTLVDTDMVERLLAVQASCLTARVAAIGSRFRDTRGQTVEPIRMSAQGEHWEEVESVITSGCLLSLRAYADVGPFRDDFFIDYVDTEFCFRARAAGFRVIQTRAPLMSHTVGAPTSHTVFGNKTWTTNHSAERRYYIARNNTVMLREYGTFGRGHWLWKSLTRSFRLSKRIAFFETDKFNKIAAVWQGWRDALRGRMGPRRG
jgi:rhamnosyltransferase